jgi:hypothetical protein
MEYPEGVAAKRRVLVDALTMVLERSQVARHVDAQTVKSVLDMAAPELWREGEFRLEYVWKILCQQPGLSAKEVAPAMFVFKAYEQELGVNVRLPQALSAVPRAEQVRLRDELAISKDDFQKVIGDLQRVATAEQESKAKQDAVERTREPRESEAAPEPQYASPAAHKKRAPVNPKVAIALLAVSLVAVAVALFFTFHQNHEPVSFDDVAAYLKLDEGVREKTSMMAKIVDPRWDTLPKDEQQKLAGHVFDVENAKGIHSLTLHDSSGKVRVIATDAGGMHMVAVY